ncbi:hypothetical protein B7494_g8115 [Chlorociboria aeruginascens]|nr:hypothetical protein B7494_g8115 [Chlorociboria aeruginascens]
MATLYLRKDGFTAEFEDFVRCCLEEAKVPGLAIAVVNGENIFAKGYGISKFPSVKIAPDTLFNAASMSKAFTAAAISLLVDDNDAFPDVKWDAKVESLLGGDFELADATTKEVTVEDILSHRSGLPRHDICCLGKNAKTPDTPQSITRKLRHLPLSRPLRTTYQYCNILYVAACHLVETLTGEWLGDFLRREMWQPLDMRETYLGVDEVKKHSMMEKMATGYRWNKDTEQYVEVPVVNDPEARGAGEIISSVLDWAKFLKCMIFRSGPISQAGHEELTKPRIGTGEKRKPFRAHTLYALGWEVDNFHGEEVIGHDGGINGFTSKMMFLPERKWGVVVFSNTMGACEVQEKICWGLIEEVLDVEVEKRFDWYEFHKKEEEDRKKEEKTRESIFPSLPDVPIPLALELEAYEGDYMHEGYGILIVEYKNGRLEVDARDREYPMNLSLEHVSGEFFLVDLFAVEEGEHEFLKAQFRIGEDGRVKELGVAFEEALGEELIWFERESGSSI